MNKSVRTWVDLSPELDRGVKHACQALHLNHNTLIQQAIIEFLKSRSLLPDPDIRVGVHRETRGIAEMALVREEV